MIQTLIAIIVFPLLVGYLYGRHQTNPFTTKGKTYYSKGD
jgi:hypothetical protein